MDTKRHLLILAATLAVQVASADILNTTLFSYKSVATVSGYAGGTTELTNFPVLVKLAAGSPVGFNYADCAADGSDLRFADAECNLIPHEIDTWNTEGESLVWVGLPMLTNNASFAMYYGANNPGAASTANLWSLAGYAGVWHLTDEHDSTLNGLDGTIVSGISAAALSKLGGALDFANARMSLGTTPNSDFANGFSIEAWCYPRNRSTKAIFGKNTAMSVRIEDSSIRVTTPGVKDHDLANCSIVANEWFHLGLTFLPNPAADGTDTVASQYKVYRDGDRKASLGASRIPNLSSGGEMWIGGNQWVDQSSDQRFNGIIDEFRLSYSIRSADWIKAAYDTAATPAVFAVPGSIEPANPEAPFFSAASATVDRSDVTFSATLSNVSSETDVSVFYSIGGSTFTEFPLGTLTADGTLTATATGLGSGTYIWYACASTIVNGVTYAPKSTRDTFVIAYAKDPPASYKHFTATVSYAGTPAAGVPVLLRISEDAIDGFQYADVTETGFECVDGNGNILPWEIDTWDTTGESLLWVKLPSYADGATVTVRYGGAFANARPAASEVWSGYVGVWHMSEASGSVADATGHNLDAAPMGNTANSIALSDGPVGSARQTATSAEKGYLSIPDYNSFGLGGTFTMSGWVRLTACTAYPRLFSRKAYYTDTNGWEMEMSNGSLTTFGARGSGNSPSYSGTFGTALNTDWTHVVLAYSDATLTVYQNGVQVKTGEITPATDNGLPLSIGCNSNGSETYAQGAFDECRLMIGTASAERIAAEYAAMADTNAVSYGAVVSVDMGDPRISAPVVERLSDGTFRVVAEISQNEPKAGSVKCIAGGMEFEMETASESLPATYSVILSALPAGTYPAAVQAESTGGNVVSRTAASVFHAGALVVSNVADAVEMTLSPGTFRISRADADATGLPAITFDVAFSGPGLAAVEPPTVTTLTIPAGAASVDVSVTPVYTTAVDTDTLLTLSVSSAFVGTPSSGSITIVNTTLDPSVRYVATTGDDENLGITSDQPKKTIAAAISSLDAIVQTLPCTVHVAPGLYPITVPIALNQPIRVLGNDPDPSRVVVLNKTGANYLSGNYRVFTLNHADALVANLTMQEGSSWGCSGSCFHIQSNGGTVSNCVVKAGETAGGGASCGGGLLDAGLVSHCIFRKCTVGSGETSDGNVNYRPAVLWLLGSSAAENCLFVDNTQYAWKALSLVKLEGNSSMRNCTIADSGLGTTNDQCAVFAPLYIHSSNVTVQNVVVVGVTNRVDGEHCCPAAGHVSRFINGATDADISGVGFAEDTVTGTAAEFFEDYANGDYTPSAFSPLANAGVEYEGMASVDLAGKKRKFGKGVDIGCYECQKTPGLLIFVR